MSPFPAGIQADMQAQIADSFNDVATNTRTSATINCIINADTREERIQGLPNVVRLRRWRLTAAIGSDLRAGDTVTVPGKGTFLMLETEIPKTYPVSLVTFAVQQRLPDGSSPLFTNNTVTFRQPKGGDGGLTLTTPVLIYPASYDVQLLPYAADFSWSIVWDGALTYSDATPVSQDDQVTWAYLSANKRPALRHVEQQFSPLRLSRAVFKEETF